MPDASLCLDGRGYESWQMDGTSFFRLFSAALRRSRLRSLTLSKVCCSSRWSPMLRGLPKIRVIKLCLCQSMDGELAGIHSGFTMHKQHNRGRPC